MKTNSIIIKSTFSRFYKIVICLLLAIFCNTSLFAQNAGDYRSSGNGIWTTLTSWQRYNGASWATPTSAQGYPGQYNGTGDVTIQAGHKITIGNGGVITQSMGNLTILNTGQLYLTGGIAMVNFTINSMEVIVNSGGSIYFQSKSKLVLPENAVLYVTLGGLVGDCNNNCDIYIGLTKFATCNGAPGTIYTFDQLMAGGGTLNAVPSSNSPICPGQTINLTGNYSGAIGTNTTYSWSVTAPGGGITTYNTQNVSIPSAVQGTYLATLTVSTTLLGAPYSNAQTISITVNPLPTLSGASQQATVCAGSGASINLTGLIPNNTFTVNYSINGTPQTPVSGLSSSSSGTSSFTSAALTTNNNGQTLRITGITITNPTSNCQQTFTRDVTLSVWQDGSWIGTTSGDWNTGSNWCSGVVPTSTTDVIIHSSAPNQPVIGAAGGICRNITINSEAYVTISGTNTLTVYGNWVNNGSFIANSSTVIFNGTTPISGSATNTFNHITINASKSLTAPASANINVNGNFINSGSFSHNNGTITFNGTTAQTINSGGNSFNNLTITNTGGTCTASTNAITISGTFTTASGSILNMATYALSVNTVSHSGTLLTQNTSASPITTGKTWGGTVNYNSTSTAQTAMPGTYNNLTISTTGGATAGGNINVNGILNLAAANPSATKGCLDLVSNWQSYPSTGNATTSSFSSSTLYMGASSTSTGEGGVTGIITRNTIDAYTSYSFGNQYNTISIIPGTSATIPSSITVIIKIGVAPADKPDAINRCYQIIPSNGSNCYISANFHYLDSELNGNSESQLVTWDYDLDGGGAIPDEHGRSAYDFTNNYVGLSNIPIEYFIYDASTHPWHTIMTLAAHSSSQYLTWTGDALNTDWTNTNNWNPVGNYPHNGDEYVIIPDIATTHNFSPVLPTGNTTINTLSIESGGILTMGNNTLTIANTLSAGWEDQNVNGNDPATSTVIFANPGATVSGTGRFYNLIINASASLTNATNSIVKIENTITKNGDWYVDVYDNTVEYVKAGNQTIVVPYNSVYHNLSLSGSGSKDLPALTQIHGNLTLSGTVSSSTATAQAITGNVSIGVGSTFVAGSLTHSVGGNWTNNGTFTATGSTINFNGNNSGNIGSCNFNNITFSGAGTKTATGILTISGNVNISNNFTAGSFTHSVGGNWTNSGTFTATGSTIEFNGNNSGNINSSNFNNITLSGDGAKTATGALSIDGNVNISNNFTAGSFTHTGGGNWTNSGTFTATGSTIEFNGSNSGNIGSSNFNNITLSGAGTKTATGILTITGNVDITNNFTAGSFTHSIGGNWINNGTFTATGSTIEFNGSNSGNISSGNFNNITFSGAGTKTATGSLSVDGNFNISNNFTAGSFTHTIGRNWSNSGTFTATGSTIEFNGTNTGDIGTSNFNNISFSGAGTKSATGILTITGNVIITNNFTAGNYTHTVGENWTNSGSFTATGSTINFNGTNEGNIGTGNFNNITFSGAGTKSATGELTIEGNVDITNNFTAGNFTHSVGGNWSKSGTFTATGSTINFNGTNAGNIGTSNFDHIGFSGAGTKTATGILNISGNMLITNNLTAGNFAHTLAGNFNNNGTYTAGTGSITFNGSELQTIFSGGTSFYDVIFNNNSTGNINLNITDPMIITHNSTFTDGISITTGTGLLCFNSGASSNGGSSTSFIDGYVKKIGNTEFSFPTGNNGLFAPISITAADAGGNITDYFTAKYINENPTPIYTAVEDPINNVSTNEYWILDRNGTTNNVKIILSWDTRSGGITDTTNLIVAHWDGSKWIDEGRSSSSGNLTTGTITSNLVTSFSPFTFGSYDNNPLPISLLSFIANLNCTNSTINIKWDCASEINNDYFTLERSTDLENWQTIANIEGVGNSNSITQYSYTDSLKGFDKNFNFVYYRLKQTDYDSKYTYPKMIAVKGCNANNISDTNLIITPNPFSKFIKINYQGIKSGNITINITDATGKCVALFTFNANTSNNIAPINLSHLTPGVYMVTISDNDIQTKIKIVKISKN